MTMWSTKIIGTGSYLPKKTMRNEDFLSYTFYKKDGVKMAKATSEIVRKLETISEIAERRYVADDEDCTSMSTIAAEAALADAGIDKNTLDQIIFAHNVGNVPKGDKHLDLIPNLAARLKHNLGITNEECVAYDVLFGCPGWVQGMILGHTAFCADSAKRILVVGADILSRVVDTNDLDSMLFSDGAGATIIERQPTEEPSGVLAFKTVSSCQEDVNYIHNGKKIRAEEDGDDSIYYVKMNGRGVYRYGLEKVPAAIHACLEKANIPVTSVDKFLIHQANGKMIKQMVQKLFEMEGLDSYPESVLPLSVQFTGNSSVATIPTLLDLIEKGELEQHEIKKGAIIVFASVGAGMHANCIVYRV